MNLVEHLIEQLCVATDKPFEKVAREFERQLGRFDRKLIDSHAVSMRAVDAKVRIEAMAGPSGFVLFGKTDFGSLLRRNSQKQKTVKYVVDNPVINLQMTQHDIRACMLFGKSDHGSATRHAGLIRKAVQYVVGNPVIALHMAQHDIRASLYALLQVFLYEKEEGLTCVEYDRPSTRFKQLGNAEISAGAGLLDHKMEALVTKAIG
jgi:uncharacterized protein (DUF302 family)